MSHAVKAVGCQVCVDQGGEIIQICRHDGSIRISVQLSRKIQDVYVGYQED